MKRRESLEFVINVSGQPYDKVIVGLAGYDPANISKILRALNARFPPPRIKRKASKLDEKTLLKIVEFLDQEKIMMGTITFTSDDWQHYRLLLGQKSFFKERIFGILYFELLKEFAQKETRYSVTVCEEHFINIRKVLETCRKLARANHYIFDFSTGRTVYNERLRLADIVAACERKIKKERFPQLSHYKRVKKVFAKEEVDKAFELK